MTLFLFSTAFCSSNKTEFVCQFISKFRLSELYNNRCVKTLYIKDLLLSFEHQKAIVRKDNNSKKYSITLSFSIRQSWAVKSLTILQGNKVYQLRKQKTVSCIHWMASIEWAQSVGIELSMEYIVAFNSFTGDHFYFYYFFEIQVRACRACVHKFYTDYKSICIDSFLIFDWIIKIVFFEIWL